VTRLWAKCSGFRTPKGAINFPLLQNFHINSAAYTGGRFPGAGMEKQWGVRFTTHLHLERSLRIGGVIPLFPLYTFKGINVRIASIKSSIN
jgi:hypothetical protein